MPFSILAFIFIFAQSLGQLSLGQAPSDSLQDVTGATVILSKVSPRRIVSLAPSIAEMVFDILGSQGTEERVVGVSEYTDYPDLFLTKPKIGPYVSFEIEKVVSLKPDLVIATTDGNPRERVLKMRALGIPVLVVAQNSFAEIFQAYILLGTALGEKTKALAIVEQMKKRLQKHGGHRAKDKIKPRVVVQIGDHPTVVVGKGTFLSEVIENLGVENVFGKHEARYPHPSDEQVLALQPDQIIMVELGDAHGKFIEAKAAWDRLFKSGGTRRTRVTLLKADELVRPSVRLFTGMDALAAEIWK